MVTRRTFLSCIMRGLIMKQLLEQKVKLSTLRERILLERSMAASMGADMAAMLGYNHTEEDLARVEQELEAVNLAIEEQMQRQMAEAMRAAAEKAAKPAAPAPAPAANPVFQKLEALYPERKVFALDSIDSTLREQLAHMYREHGYPTVEALLEENGFSLISGEEVRKIRSFVLYTPGTEPEIIRPKVESMLQRLQQYYPNKVIERSIQQDHKSLSQTISGLYQWLGYADTGAMLEAYGYRYNVGASGRPENDYDAVIGALVEKYRDKPKPKNMGILIYDNPEFKGQLKTMQNKAQELFGMTLKKYFEELGLFEEKSVARPSQTSAAGGAGTMQDAAFAALMNLYSTLDSAVYGTYEDACALLKDCTVKKNKAGQLYIFRCLSAPEDLIIPHGIHFISDDAFANQTAIRTLKLPATLEKIGNSAFSGCTNLERITFAEGLQIIGGRAFENCAALKQVHFPATLQSVGVFAFRDCGALVQAEAANPMTFFEEGAFHGCPIPVEPEDTCGVDTADFLYETDRKNHVTITGYTGSLEKLVIPRKIDGKPVVAIGKSAFEGNLRLREISMPDSITTLQNYAFRECGNLERVHLSNSIGRLYTSTFSGCSSLKAINLPDALTELKRGTLRDTPLETLHIGKGLQKIQANFFYHEEYDSFTGELTDCRNVGYITVDPENPNFIAEGSCVFSKDGTKLLAALGKLHDYRIPEGVLAVDAGAFDGLVSLTDISFPDSLEEIGEYAFTRTSLRRVHFPGGIRTIGNSAFAYCMKLSSAVFDEGVETIERLAFAGCPLASVSLPASVRSLGSECFPCFSPYDQNMRDFRIAEDNPWLKADGSALYRMDGSDTILCAFYGYTYRQQVFNLWGNKPESPAYVVAEGTTVIGQEAFRNCANIGEVVLPYGLLRIEDRAFEGCGNLTAAEIPESVTHIGAGAFRGCAIESIEIPASVVEIQDGAFAMGSEWEENDSPLARIRVAPENRCFRVQGSCLFRQGTEMELLACFGNAKTLVIPDDTTRIGAYAFYKSGVTQVQIPAAVRSIGERAFFRSMQLKRLVIDLPVPENGVKSATIYIPEVTADAFGYQNPSDRDQFLDCIRIDGDGTLFDFVKYDGLFDTISRMEDKILVATDRLKSAVGLIDHYRQRYLRYLQDHADQAVKIVIACDDINGLNTLAQLGVFNMKNISRVIELAVAAGRTDIVGFLMEHQHQDIGFSGGEWEL